LVMQVGLAPAPDFPPFRAPARAFSNICTN
jgi:hypothetical protein